MMDMVGVSMAKDILYCQQQFAGGGGGGGNVLNRYGIVLHRISSIKMK